MLFYRDDLSVTTIYIDDRDYVSYNNIVHIMDKEQKLIIKVKDLNKFGIISKLPRPDTNEFDISVSVVLTRS